MDLHKGGDSKQPNNKENVLAARQQESPADALEKAKCFFDTVGEDLSLANKRKRNKGLITKPVCEATAQRLSLVDDYCIMLFGVNLELCRNIDVLEAMGLREAVSHGKEVPYNLFVNLLLIAVPKSCGCVLT